MQVSDRIARVLDGWVKRVKDKNIHDNVVVYSNVNSSCQAMDVADLIFGRELSANVNISILIFHCNIII